MKAKDLKEIIMSGQYDGWTVKELAIFIRKLEDSTDKILNNVKEIENETVKHDR